MYIYIYIQRDPEPQPPEQSHPGSEVSTQSSSRSTTRRGAKSPTSPRPSPMTHLR